MSTLILNEEMLAAFGSYLRTNEKSPYTIEKYLRDAGAFCGFASGRPLTKELAVDYKRLLIESGKYADSSINSMLASLRGLFRFLGREDCSVARLRTQEAPYCPENKNLMTEEYQRLLKAAKDDERTQLILKVLAGTGIRVSELKYFTVEALRKRGRHAAIRVSCKKKSREILVADELQKELLDYIRRKEIREGPVFCTGSGKALDRSNLWKQLKRLCKKAGVDEDKVFPHNFRKLFARTFYEGYHDIAQLACLLGHSSVNTTMLYIKRTEREVRAKVDRLLKVVLHGSREVPQGNGDSCGKGSGEVLCGSREYSYGSGEVSCGREEVSHESREVPHESGEVPCGSGDSCGSGECSCGGGEVSCGRGEVLCGSGEYSYGSGEVLCGRGEVSHGSRKIPHESGEVSRGSGGHGECRRVVEKKRKGSGELQLDRRRSGGQNVAKRK